MSWHPEDQDKALAWLVDDADKCPGCGTHSWERVSFSTVICPNCRDHQLFAADESHKGKPGLLISMKRRDDG